MARDNIKIVFFGTPEFAVKSLESLYRSQNIEVLAVFTQPDKPVGRKQTLTPPPVKEKALELGLKVHQPKDKKALVDMLRPFKADFFVVIAFGMVFPKEALDIAKYGAINVHASLLPKYRGASPIQESLLHGDAETGLTIMKMGEELDNGDIFLIRRFTIDKSDNSAMLSQKLANLSAQILPLVLSDIKNGILKPVHQNHEKATFCHKINKEDGKIDWNKPAVEILNMLRAYTPWPGVYTHVKGKKLSILEADIESGNIKPNEFVIEKNSLKIGAGSGIVLPTKVKLEGKNETTIKDFLNGNQNLFG